MYSILNKKKQILQQN